MDETTPNTSASPDAPAQMPAQPSAGEPAPPATPRRKKRRGLRIVLWVVGALVLLLGLFVALLPTLLSTGPGTNVVRNIIAGQVNGSVRLDDLSLGWTSGTEVRGLRIQDPQQRAVVEMASLETDMSVAGAIQGFFANRYDLGPTTFDVNLPLIRVYEDGTTNLHEVMPILFEESDTEAPHVYGQFNGTARANIQYLGGPNAEDDSPPVDVSLEDALVVLQPGVPLENRLPIDLRVAGQSAGSIRFAGTADIEGAAAAAEERITVDQVDLAAISVVSAAFGYPIDFEGTANGALAASIDMGKLPASEDATLGEQIAGLLVAVTGLEVNLQTPFMTIAGGGETLDGLEITYNADIDAINEGLRNLPQVQGIQAGGQLSGTLRTTGQEGGLQAAFEAQVANLSLVDTAADEPKAPLNLANANLNITAAVVAEGDDVEVPEAQVMVTASDSTGEILVLNATAADVTAGTGSIGRLDLASLAIPDYPRARQALGGWVELPEAVRSPGPIVVAGVLAWDGEARQVAILEPLAISANEQLIATVGATATLPETGAGPVQVALELPNLPALNDTLAAFGQELSAAQPPEGTVGLSLQGTIDSSAEDVVASLAGNGALRLTGLAVQGLRLDGEVPINAAGGFVGVPGEATPLNANGGTVALGGMSLDVVEMRLTLPEGDIIQNVSLNPVLADALGQYINPLLTNPTDASGLLDISVTEAANLNLANLLGPEGGQVTVQFAVRELYLDNDVIGTLAEQFAGQAEQVLLDRAGRAASIPGLNLRELIRERIDVSQEVKEEISSVRGNIAESTVRLNNGVASTRITFNLADPRTSDAEADNSERYPLTFTGDVNVETLGMSLGATMPVNLIEKWAGENPGDLVDLFGEQPFRRIMPNGLTLGFDGTTQQPRIDALESLNEIAPRAVNALIENRTGDVLPGGLQEGLRDLFR